MACQASADGCCTAGGHCQWPGHLHQMLSSASPWSLRGAGPKGGRWLSKGQNGQGLFPIGNGKGTACQSLLELKRQIICRAPLFLPAPVSPQSCVTSCQNFVALPKSFFWLISSCPGWPQVSKFSFPWHKTPGTLQILGCFSSQIAKGKAQGTSSGTTFLPTSMSLTSLGTSRT